MPLNLGSAPSPPEALHRSVAGTPVLASPGAAARALRLAPTNQRPDMRTLARLVLPGRLVAILVCAAPGAHAQLLTNGGFEQGPVIPLQQAVQAVAPGNTALTGWTVTAGAVTIVTDNYWSPKVGARSLALCSSGPGSIEQAFGTAVGASYRLTFWQSGEPFSSPTIKHLRVQAGPAQQEFTFDNTEAWHWDMGWELRSLEFTATSTSTVIRFTSLDASPWGPAIDDAAVELLSMAVPPTAPHLALAPIAPDPVRTESRIAFTLPSAAHARIALHDVQGREVAELAAGEFAAGAHEVRLAPRALRAGAGLHFVSVVSGGERVVRRCILLP